jgi:hypothetical protein
VKPAYGLPHTGWRSPRLLLGNSFAQPAASSFGAVSVCEARPPFAAWFRPWAAFSVLRSGRELSDGMVGSFFPWVASFFPDAALPDAAKSAESLAIRPSMVCGSAISLSKKSIYVTVPLYRNIPNAFLAVMVKNGLTGNKNGVISGNPK